MHLQGIIVSLTLMTSGIICATSQSLFGRVSKPKKEPPTDYIPTAEGRQVLRWRRFGIPVEYTIDKIWSLGTDWTIYSAYDRSANEKLTIKLYKNQNCRARWILDESRIIRQMGERAQVSQDFADCYLVRNQGSDVETLEGYLERYLPKLSDPTFFLMLEEVFIAIDFAHSKGIFISDTRIQNILVGKPIGESAVEFLDYSRAIYSENGIPIMENNNLLHSRAMDYFVFLNSIVSQLSRPNDIPGMSEELLERLKMATKKMEYALDILRLSNNPVDIGADKSILEQLKTDLGY